MLRRIGRLIFKLIPLWSWRLCYYGTVAALVLVCGMVLSLRYWLLPNIESYRAEVEAALTKATGQRISIGQISGDWHGWHPRLAFGGVTVYDKSGHAALTLVRIDNTLSWLSLLFLEPRFYSLEVQQPELAVRRLADGSFSVAGIDLGKVEHGGGLSDWLLRQREVIIRRGSISWVDDKLRAPELRLDEVSLRLSNDFHRHRFGLRARAPAQLAGPLDVRGDFQGRSIQATRAWEGRIFAQLDYADLAAWKRWIPLPIEVAQATGALRVWVDIGDDRVTGVTADLRLANVKAQLAANLQPLELGAVSGRLGWRTWKQGYELYAHQLAMVDADGVALPRTELRLRRTFARVDKPAGGQLKADALELEPLARIADKLPIEAELRTVLARYEPRGSVHALEATWSGDWPPQKYDVKAGFSQLGVNATETTPGLSNVSGSVAANDRRGTLRIANRATRVELRNVFAQALAFDDIAGQISWTSTGGEYDIRSAGLSFANADLAGTLQGSYRTATSGRGIADLTGVLTRADARQVAKYLPLTVDKAIRDWLAGALIAGYSNDVRLRLKGDLNDFPFAAAGKGIFEVKVRGRGGVVDYGDGWPRVENIVADVDFVGSRMQIRCSAATILGVQIARASAAIEDLKASNEILDVSGEAAGGTPEFLRFINSSPVAGMIDRFSEGMEVTGRGRLAMKMTIPLRSPKDARVSGSYQFANNRLLIDADFAPLEQVNGRLNFTEAAVSASGIATQILGGPASVDVATQQGAIVLSATGHADLRKLHGGANPWLDSISGSTDWRGTVTVRGKLVDAVVESNLQGVSANLPPPFAKSANESLAFRFRRLAKLGQADQVDVSLGNVVAISAQRRREGRQMKVERAAVGFSTELPEAQGPGVWVRGVLGALDVDAWRRAMARSGAGEFALPELMAVDLKVGALDAFGRRFNDFSATGRSLPGRWQGVVAAREFNGELTWQGEGGGRLSARLSRLVLPPALERAEAPNGASEQRGNYPALDIVVEDFQYKARALGRLELAALPEGLDWRIERLRVNNPDGSFTADGHWRRKQAPPHTRLNVRLEVKDIAKFLARLGYPEGVRGSDARLSGALSWSGAPQDIDFPTLAGNLVVEAGKGQFVKLDPGIGKLLSILSLQALPRRVTLDFKDVFSEGFAFDAILGAMKLERGVGTTDGFRINGSSAQVSMSGEIDFAHETQKLRVRVVPSVGDSVATVTALLGGPVAGLGVFLAQKLLKDPLGQLIAYDYAVTGTWSEPQVTKIPVERVLTEPNSE